MLNDVCTPPYCGLCRFKFNNGDVVDTACSTGLFSKRLIFNEDFYRDKQQSIIYRVPWLCLSVYECGCNNTAIAFHPTCAALYDDTLPNLFISASQDKALVYDFEPAGVEHERRASVLQRDLAEILRRGLLSRLPIELCGLVASHCFHEYAAARVVLGRWQGVKKVGRSEYEVNIGDSLIAGFVEVDGVRYLASLAEWANDDGDKYARAEDGLWEILAVRTEFDTIYLAMDHYGIREIFLESAMKPPVVSRRLGIWWKILRLEKRPTMLVKHDGLKIRKLLIGPEPSKDNVYTAIPFAGSPLRIELFSRSREPPSKIRTFRLQPVRPLESRTRPTGYSFCKGVWGRPYVHSEDDNTDSGKLLPKGSPMLWTYVPMDKDEVIIELWYLWSSHGVINLVLVTNQGRVTVIGTPNYYLTRRTCRLIEYSSTGIGQLWVDEHRGYINLFAFASPQPEQPRSYPRLPRPIFSDPDTLRRGGFSFSWAADLHEVVEVALCRHIPAADVSDDIRTLGVLLRYRNGHKTTLGQVRLDKLGPWVRVDDGSSTGLWLMFEMESRAQLESRALDQPWQVIQQARIARIALSEEALYSKLPLEEVPPLIEVFKIPWTGRVECSYSETNCRVYHEGRSISLINLGEPLDTVISGL